MGDEHTKCLPPPSAIFTEVMLPVSCVSCVLLSSLRFKQSFFLSRLSNLEHRGFFHLNLFYCCRFFFKLWTLCNEMSDGTKARKCHKNHVSWSTRRCVPSPQDLKRWECVVRTDSFFTLSCRTCPVNRCCLSVWVINISEVSSAFYFLQLFI